MLARLVPVVAIALGLASLSGCGPDKLNVEKTLNLSAEYPARSVDMPPQKKAQTITVDFTSSADVLVLLFKEDDAKGDDAILTAGEAKALGKQKGKSGSFSAEVPANTATRVVARDPAGAKADVQIKITNKK